MELVTDDDTIIGLAQRSDVVAAFPVFQQIRRRLKPGCSRCTKNKAAGLLNQIKVHLSQLTPEQRQQFKSLVGADSVRVIYPENGAAKELTF